MGPVLRSTITISLLEHSISGRPFKAVAQLGELPIMLNMEERVMVTVSGLTVEGEKYKYLWAKFTSCVFFCGGSPIFGNMCCHVHVACIVYYSWLYNLCLCLAKTLSGLCVHGIQLTRITKC